MKTFDNFCSYRWIFQFYPLIKKSFHTCRIIWSFCNNHVFEQQRNVKIWIEQEAHMDCIDIRQKIAEIRRNFIENRMNFTKTQCFSKQNTDGELDGKDQVARSRDLCGWKSIKNDVFGVFLNFNLSRVQYMENQWLFHQRVFR